MSNNSLAINITAGIKKRFKTLFANPYRKVNVNWMSLKYYKHLPANKIRHHRLFGKPFYFYSAQELLHGLQEIFIDEIYKQQLTSNPFIIDCGANIGMSVIYMKQQYPEAEIIAFEPDEKNFELLTKNIMSFGYSNVKLLKKAVWNSNTDLYFSNESSMGSRIEKETSASTIEVSAVRLKDFIDRRIDFLKIDIEGAESTVLRDIAEKLHLVKNMFLEYHGTFQQNNELVEIVNILNQAEFKFYIKEAASIYNNPFHRVKNPNTSYDVQLNIFCFRDCESAIQ